MELLDGFTPDIHYTIVPELPFARFLTPFISICPTCGSDTINKTVDISPDYVHEGVFEMPMEKCKCGKNRSVNVGDRIRDGKYSWYMSSHCEYCGETIEMDGYGIFDIPYDVEQEIIKRDGEWGIIAKGSVTKINFLLKKILNNEYHIENVHKGNEIYTGTQEQVKWVKDRLVEKGISEKELEIIGIL